MKNKTIEILTDGICILPVGTKLTQYNNGSVCNEETVPDSGKEVAIFTMENIVNEVDFSGVPKLYPHKGMEIPEEGIEFADGNGKLLDVGENGFMFFADQDEDCDGHYDFRNWSSKDSTEDCFKLKRTLPKTIQVCAGCFKEVEKCECVREEGWYRVRSMDNKWYIRYYVNGTFYTHKDGRSTGAYREIDWNPINVIPEGEV